MPQLSIQLLNELSVPKAMLKTINQGLTLVLQVLDKDQTFRQEDLRTLFYRAFFLKD